ncbi:Unannotated [Lentimonas sp. CC4]|nr:Unannotated [Lentimonas sp. CC4]CAA6687348.1 Unannotated [Lentimonas sp. CC6]CAA7078020.1 Unannotated [Lentimonas sp. CC4]CAA7167990.1 Unannotated [Lentimonas sp. CC21]CAA7179564.1 Unannotated [Lentimonas sp. CC8]
MKSPIYCSIIFFTLISVLFAKERPKNFILKGEGGWSYLHITNGVDPGEADADFHTTWYKPLEGSYNGPSFNHNYTSPFQYGDVGGFEVEWRTTLEQPPEDDRYTSYFYKVFESDAEYSEFDLSVLVDDGAFVYLNGVLIARDGTSGEDTYYKLADTAGSENSYDKLEIIGNPVILAGQNVLAVSVHQVNADNDDIGLDVALASVVEEEEPDTNVYTTFTTDGESGWYMLSPIQSGDGYDPKDSDPDFDTTWHNQSIGSYSGVAYNGPSFSSGHASPFAYGGLVFDTDTNTTIPEPSSETRYSAYFIKEIDGGANGYDSIDLIMKANDAAYIYINGEHVTTVGKLPEDASEDEWGLQAQSQGTLKSFTYKILKEDGILKPGPNLLAVSLHNEKTRSDDLGFSLTLVESPYRVPEVTRGPYLQSPSHQQMIVQWRTTDPGTSKVRYGSSPTNLNKSVTINGSNYDHIVTITGLQPETKYYYKVESDTREGVLSKGGEEAYSFTTYPAPGTRKKTRLWVLGDSGTDNYEKHAVYEAYQKRYGNEQTDGILMLGDNAYSYGTDEEFQVAVFDSYTDILHDTPLWSCFGNHDNITQNGEPYFTIHSFPKNGECGGIASGSENYYSFDVGNIHVVALDSQNYHGAEPGDGGMIDWLELDLQATDKDWIIAMFHHGAYTKGSHDSDSEERHYNMRKYATPLLERYGVDLVLAGHSHNYERSMFINGHHGDMSDDRSPSEDFNNSHKVNDGNGSDLGSINADGNYIEDGGDGIYTKPLATGEAGTVYTIVGASGKIADWDNGSDAMVNPEPHPVHIVNLRLQGGLVIEVEDNTLKAQYLDYYNQVRDDYTILKGSMFEVTSTDSEFHEYGTDNKATFTVTRTGLTDVAEEVAIQLDGSASLGADYNSNQTATLSFPENVTQNTFQVTSKTDDLSEGTELVTVTLQPNKVQVDDGSGMRNTYLISESDSATASLYDKPSQDWLYRNPPSQQGSPDEVWTADTDNDGLTSLEEFAFGGGQDTNDQSIVPYITMDSESMKINYQVDTTASDVDVVVQQSPDLENWYETGVEYSQSVVVGSNGLELRQGATSVDEDEEKKFLRLKIDIVDGTSTNYSPTFSQPLLVIEDAEASKGYSGSIVSYADDANNDALIFTKISGPDWFVVSSDGSYSGTPTSADVGQHSVVIEVSDQRGGTDTITLEITVAPVVVSPSDSDVVAYWDGDQGGAATTPAWQDSSLVSATLGTKGVSSHNWSGKGSTDASFGTIDAPAAPDNAKAWQVKNGEQQTFSVENTSENDLQLNSIHFDYANIFSDLTIVLSYDSGDLTDADGTILSTTAMGASLGDTSDWNDADVALAPLLSDTVLAPGETAVFKLVFTGSGSSASGLDNLAVTASPVVDLGNVVAYWDGAQDDPATTPAWQDSSLVSATLGAKGVSSHDWSGKGSADASFGTIDTPAAPNNTMAWQVKNGQQQTFSVQNTSSSDLQLNSIHFDYANIFSDLTIVLSYDSGDLTDADGTILSTTAMGEDQLGALSDWNDADVALAPLLSDTVLAPGETAVFKLVFTGSGSSASGLDNLAVTASPL